MFKFDVKYTYDNYYEYYKFVLIRQRILKDILFFILFVGVAIYWWVGPVDQTDGDLIPILSLIFACGLPLMNFITIPMIKKQLHQRQEDIDRTHIAITFNEEDVLYENLTIDPYEGNKKAEIKETIDENDKEDELETKDVSTGENVQQDNPVEDEKTFVLKYINFLVVRESANLFMFYLDRQTVVIIPKERFVEGGTLADFKNFILTKIDPKRVKFLKEKVEK